MADLSLAFSNTISQGAVTSDVSVTSAGTTVVTQNAGTTTKVTFNYDSTTVNQYVNKSKTAILTNQPAGISALALDTPQYPYGDPYFENVVLPSYLENIKSNATVMPLTNLDTYKYEGDFYGILNELDVPLAYHQITLRLNGFSDTALYDRSISTILVPDTTQLDQIAAVYANTVPNPF